VWGFGKRIGDYYKTIPSIKFEKMITGLLDIEEVIFSYFLQGTPSHHVFLYKMSKK